MLRVPAFVIISGGSDGAAHVQRLLRAVAARRLHAGRILVVDRDPGCAVGRLIAAGSGLSARIRPSLEVADWSEWLDVHLDGLESGAQLVPYHWAPHLLLRWLESQAARSGVTTSRAEPLTSRGLPFESATSDGDRALSYASWPCPPACIEPALCPHTRGPRDWSLAGDLDEPQPGEAVDERIVFRCLHLVWGVGTIPVDEIRAGRDRLLAVARDRPRTVLVATSSHCHALATPITLA